ncbi:MAG: DUF4157 domain-containing protein [Aggregatilineales bacterium]
MGQRADKEAKPINKRTATPNAPDHTPTPQADLRQLQRMVGNQTLQRMLAEGAVNLGGNVLQAKMTVGEPDDQYEQEADSVAQQVMTMPDASVQREMPEEEELLQAKPISALQREGLEEEEMLQGKLLQREGLEEEELQAKPIDTLQREMPEEEEMLQGKSAGVPEVTEDVEGKISSMKGGGQALPESTREFLEPRFGQDFSGVNIHTGNDAHQLNEAVQARAFTTGNDIFFRDGEYSPDSSAGRELLAHELTHVVQQGGSEAQRKSEDET